MKSRTYGVWNLRCMEPKVPLRPLPGGNLRFPPSLRGE